MRTTLGNTLPRLLSPLFDSCLWRLPESAGARAIHLSFDDGPTPDGTEELLDVLASYAVPATFFLVGERAARHPQLVKAILAAGHQLGNHTWSHADSWKISRTELLKEMDRTTDLLEQLAGRSVRWLRPPFGHLTLPLIRWSRSRPQPIVMWDVVVPDYDPRTSLPLVQRILRRYLRPRSIVCLHDNDVSRQITPRLLREWIPRQLDAGWTFAQLPR